MTTSDKYDEEINRLVDRNAEYLYASWANWSPLFKTAGPGEYNLERPDTKCCGCLTQIRMSAFTCAKNPEDRYWAWTDELTEQIVADESIPASIELLCKQWGPMSRAERIGVLQPFAKWQRRLDVEVRGKVAA